MLDLPLENFVVGDGQHTLCQPGLVIALFTPTLEGTETLRSPLNAFLRRFSSELEWYLVDPQESRSKKLPVVDRDDFLAELASRSMDASADASLELRGTSDRMEWVPPLFDFHKSSAPDAEMSIWMGLSLAWLEAQGVEGLDIFLDEMLVGGFPFRHGYIGLGLICNHRAAHSASLKLRIHDWAIQHPGLMASEALGQSYVASHGLVDIGWITLLAAEEAKKVGGGAGIRERLAETSRDKVTIRELPGGALAIRAGDLPVFGDLNANGSLEHQAAVGKALRPLWNRERNSRVVLTGFETTKDFTEQGKWANRFFAD
jgi:hypothetical protein